MSSVIRQFLLIIDRERDEMIAQDDYGTDSARAVAAYGEAERKYKDRPEVDVLLVGSDSLESVKVTHSTFFPGFNLPKLSDLLDLMPPELRAHAAELARTI